VTESVPVELRARDRPPSVPAPTPRSRSQRWKAAARRRARLASFFAQLAVKEHLRPDLDVRPLVAELFLTENCNLKCISCACWRDTTRHELTTDEWRSAIDQVADAGIVKINFTGGEPLLRRDAALLIAHARDRGIDDLHLNTNAILLDDTRRAEVLKAGIRSFNVSVDGAHAEVHDAIRGREGAFDLTVKHLRALVAERDRYGLRVRMNFTVMGQTVDQLVPLAELAAALEVGLSLNLVTDTTFLFRADGVGDLATFDPDALRLALARVADLARRDPRWLPRFADLDYAYHHLTEGMSGQPPCAESQLKLMIHSRGEIGGCWGEDPSTDLRQTAVATLLASPAHREEAARLFRKECVGCGSNYSLNLRWRPQSYLADLQWRLGRRRIGDRSG
jgi:MoaA/NifB/PqqE/SkfB family radical SAM enzyme